MNEFDDIEASLASFTRRFDEVSSDKFNALRECSFFNPVPGESLAGIARQIELKTFAPGKRITVEGEKTNAFYIIVFGSATVSVNNKTLGTIRSGECVGESAFFSEEKVSRSATVTADGQVIAAELTRSGIDQLQGDARRHMDKALLLALFRKLQLANQLIAKLID
ncbi:MAG: cyclic nucleotide-binding domain-containing protein [Nitrosomonadales bacterium]|nr:cyclic nucleotide-binding domain-containing protein [Nitrosomonadales bacterium]